MSITWEMLSPAITRMRCVIWVLVGVATLLLPGISWSQENANFSVTVNTGPVAPNNDTVFPGEPTSLRVTLSNNSTVTPITNVTFNKGLPSGATGGLTVNGTATINGSGCSGTLSTSVGSTAVALSGLDIPARVNGIENSGECYIDIPVVAWSSNGQSASYAYALEAGEVSSDSGTNATGGPQSITVSSVSRPSWSKSWTGGGGALILGGASKTLRIQLANTDKNVSLRDFSFTDNFPGSGSSGAILEPTGEPATGSCVEPPVNGSVNLTQGSTAGFSVSGGVLAPETSCFLDVEVQARHTDGNYQLNRQNRIDAAGFNSREGITPASDAIQNITVRSPLRISKNFAASPVASGVPSSFTIVLSNSGGSDLEVGHFADNPIAAAPYADRMTVTDVDNSCGGNSNIVSSGQGFEVDGFSVPANGQCSLTVTFEGQTPNTDLPTSYTNAIPEGAVSIVGEPGIVSQARSASVIIADRLRVLKSQSPRDVAPGNPVRYQITLQNYSATPASNVTVADQLTNGATLLTSGAFAPELSAACGTLGLNGRVEGDSDLLFSVPTLPGRAGASSPGVCTLTFWAMINPDAESDTGNQIGVCAVKINGSSANCNGRASNNVSTNHQAVIGLSKRFDGKTSQTLSEGQVSRMRIRVSNYSDSPLTTLAMSDTLPVAGANQQLRIAQPANAGSTCGGTLNAVAGQTSLALNNGQVAARNPGNNQPGSCVIDVDVVGPAGVYNNTATVSAIQTNADGSELVVNTHASATLTYTDALAARKNFAPDTVGPGGESTARITLSNLDGSRPITGIDVTDNLPTGMVLAQDPNAYTTCNGNTSITATPGTDRVTLIGASLAPAASCELLFTVTVEGSSDWVNTLLPGDIIADGGLLNRTPVSATLYYQAPEVPLISKAINPGVIAPGERARLTITVTNASQDLTGLQLTDFFTEDGLSGGIANGMKVASPAQATTTCPGGVVVAEPGTEQVGVSGVNLAADEACEVAVNVTSTTVGTITNTIPMEAIVTNEGATNTTTFAQSTLSTTNSVGISKQFSPRVIAPGAETRLRITFYNTLEQSLVDFDIVDNFPAGLQIAEEANPFHTCGGSAEISWPNDNSVQLTGGVLDPMVTGVAASCYLELDVTAATEGSYTNLIPADSVTVNEEPVSHPSAEDTLEVREHIVVHKAIDDLTLDEGSPANFVTGSATRMPGEAAPLTIRLENPNDIELTQVMFIDYLPDGLVVATEPNLFTDCANAVVNTPESAKSIILTGATLAPNGQTGSTCDVRVDVLSNIPGSYVNEIPSAGVSSYEEVENQEPTQAELIVSEPGELGKTFAPPVIAPGNISRLSIVMNNPNDGDMVLSTPLVDNLPSYPAQMRVAASPNVSTSCPGGTSIADASAGSESVTIETNTVVPPGGCTLEVDVTADEPGQYLNNFSVGALKSNFGPNEEPVSSPLLVSTLGYISGKVFIDHQAVPDGRYITDESTPIPGNVIELYTGSFCSGAQLASTVTDSQGNYLFAELPAGTYSVCQPVQPSDTLNSVTTEGEIISYNGSVGSPGRASNPGTPTSQIVSIVISDNGNADEVSGSPDNNFSEVQPASIAGNVYYDVNDNGLMDSGEVGIGNVTITLSGPVSATTQTGSDGGFYFGQLPPGVYTVSETHPSGWLDGRDTIGSHGGDASNNEILTSVTLAPGDNGTEYNFGELLAEGGQSDGLSLSLSSFCDNDTPWLSYQVLSNGQPIGASSPPVSIYWYSESGRLVEFNSDLDSEGVLLWPGAKVDGIGNPVAWPGWSYVDGRWVTVEDDRRGELRIVAQINPSAEASSSYPAATPSCAAQPPGTFSFGIKGAPTLSHWALMLLSFLMTVIVYLKRHSASLRVQR
ncbi:SdrD B-like domain-containing protein [Gilvimarinus chinensis]|uniref:DUF7933 domain-containing protein n=1 Tax=Gilvimarinus chinensis TaxID=396005 RepID=UPI00037A3D24|nr:SdrD B-like domain-containing protein [Gilvimarinus chinensis]